jgi:flagellar basal body-associated protein FliL
MIDLENIEKRESYQIPENYFEELPGRVMQNIHQEQRKRRNILLSAVAAVAILVVAVGIFFTYNTPEGSTDIAQTQQTVTTAPEEEVLETIATDYYSEELAMMDYYEYAY